MTNQKPQTNLKLNPNQQRNQTQSLTQLAQETIWLALRKSYKRAAGPFHKTRDHQQFLKDCKNNKTIPKGLQIKIPCMAAAQTRTDIALQFDEISSGAERMLLEALTEHYDIVTE